MDISMPILDGFEATRQIRALESQFRQSLPPYQTPPSSLIIALTGLASGRDQSEAFTSGFDLYLVKPISFREVGRLLDNWEKSGASATVGGKVPYGPVTEAEVEREVDEQAA
jgi:CheY-like chemotaxis protein